MAHDETPMVQREEAGASAAPETTVTASSAASSPGTDEAHSDKSMDELASRLYDRIRARLKTELLVDRERAGFLTDLR
jgi:hypothetical protein